MTFEEAKENVIYTILSHPNKFFHKYVGKIIYRKGNIMRELNGDKYWIIGSQKYKIK